MDYEDDSLFKRMFFLIIRFILIIFIIGFFIFLCICGFFYVKASKFDLHEVGNMSERSIIYDCKKRKIYRMHGENRTIVPLNKVSKHFINALIAREDSRFYKHGGIDFIGFGRAVYQNIMRSKVAQGASTITMQLARNSYGMFEKSIYRKILEMFISYRIENNFSKDEILNHYVNRIYFGDSYYGIEKASQAFFQKPASQLSIGEGAMLAGIIRSPNPLSPHRHSRRAHLARNSVLSRMVLEKFIDEDKAEQIKKTRETIIKRKKVITNDPNRVSYATDIIQRQLKKILNEKEIQYGGLLIYTTIDIELQKLAENNLNRHLRSIENYKRYTHQKKINYNPAFKKPPKYLQGSIVMIDNKTGGLKAVVGGRNYQHSFFNRAIQAKRQLGSLFKPIVFASAYYKGLLPGTYINDDEIKQNELFTIDVNWNPENSDKKYYGLKPAEWGLIKSRNTMSVRVGQYAGLNTVSLFANLSGLSSKLEPSPVSYLGVIEETPLSITSAYTAFANRGIRNIPYVIDEIYTKDKILIYKHIREQKKVYPTIVAELIHRGLRKVFTNGTALSASQYGFVKPAGGKTGTTDNYKDAWFVGYTSSLTCGVWVGMDQSIKIMNKGYGSTLALPIWARIMNKVDKYGYKNDSFEFNEEKNSVKLCRLSSQLSNEICSYRKFSYPDLLPQNAIPTKTCKIHTNKNKRHNKPYRARKYNSPNRRNIFDTFKHWFNN